MQQALSSFGDLDMQGPGPEDDDGDEDEGDDKKSPQSGEGSS